MTSKTITIHPEQSDPIDVLIESFYDYDAEEPDYGIRVSWWKDSEYCVETFYTGNRQIADAMVHDLSLDFAISVTGSHPYKINNPT